MNKMHVYYISVFILLSMAILSTLHPSPYANGASAEDWNRHSIWINDYIKGDFSPLTKYPSIFHLFMIIPVLILGDFIKYFQIIIAIGVIASMSYYLYKKEGKDTMILAFFIFSTSIVFQIYFFTLTPQVLDYILFPLIILAYFNRKYFTTSIGLIALIYNHLFGLIFFGIVLIYSLIYTKKFLKYAIIISILAIPVIYTFYIPTFLTFNQNYMIITKSGGATGDFSETGQIWQTEWDIQFTGTWYKFIAFTGFGSWILLPISLYLLWKRKFKITENQKFYLIWLMFFIPVCILFNIWRGMSYLTIPLTFFEASIIAEVFKDEMAQSSIKKE